MNQKKIKRIALLCFACFSLTVFSINAVAGNWNGWVPQNNKQIGVTEELGKASTLARKSIKAPIYFLNASIGWAKEYNPLTKKASIVKTEDGGNTWKTQKEFAFNADLSFFFLDIMTGWAVGGELSQSPQTHFVPLILNCFIFKTSDGGQTWVQQLKRPGGTKGVSDELNDVFFLNSLVGWAVGTNGLIFHTRDGGNNWEKQESKIKLELTKSHFVDENNGWVIGNNVKSRPAMAIILHTSDSGKHWTVQWKKETDWVWMRSIFFTDKNIGWVMGDITEYSGDALLLHTTDGGKTWSAKEFAGIHFSEIYFVDENRGVIMTEKGSMEITTDGGKQWKPRVLYRNVPYHVSEIFEN